MSGTFMGLPYINLPGVPKGMRAVSAQRRPRFRHAVKQSVRCDVKIGRNNPCACGSGKKYKKCCL